MIELNWKFRTSAKGVRHEATDGNYRRGWVEPTPNPVNGTTYLANVYLANGNGSEIGEYASPELTKDAVENWFR